MTGNLNGFNANNTEPPKDFSNLPAGDYTAVITSSEMKATNAGDGSYLNVEYTVIDEGEFANRKLWSVLNLENPSQKTVVIAESQLGAICKACAESSGNPQLITPSDSSELHDIPISISVKIKKGFNTINKWSGIQGGQMQQAPMQQTAQTAAPVQQAVQAQPQQQAASAPAQGQNNGAPWGNRG